MHGQYGMQCSQQRRVRVHLHMHQGEAMAGEVDEGQRLVELLREAIDQGLRGPGDVIAGAPGLIKIIAPRGTDHLTAALRTHEVIRASVDALGHPASNALRALYGLDPVPRGRTILLTATQRRAAAGEHIQRSGERWRRAYESTYLIDLATEILRRIRTGDDTTHGRPRGWAPYAPPPPPPASHFRPSGSPENRKSG